MSQRLPKRPRSHVLEELSRQHVSSVFPPEWIVRDVHDDYGLDLRVEIATGEAVTGCEFSIQLKATDKLKTSKDDVLHTCNVSTAHYFLNRPEPVMYLVYDAQGEAAYWLWVQPYLREQDTTRPGWHDQKNIRLRIPQANRLTPESLPAIVDHVQSWRDRVVALATARPHQAHKPLPEFVGRQDEIAQLTATLKPGAKAAITGLVAVGGMGKTELAKVVAHQVAGHFPDGVLSADCERQPLATIANVWAAAYGLQPPGDGQASRAAGWRGLVSSRRALLILNKVQPNPAGWIKSRHLGKL